VQFRSSFQARLPSSVLAAAAASHCAGNRHQRIRECTTPGGVFRGVNLGKMLACTSRLAAIG